MKTLDDAKAAIREYHDRYRNPDAAPFPVTRLYAMLKDAVPPAGHELCGSWSGNDIWPHSNGYGVYLILTAELGVLYIGKASLDVVGKRLSSHFQIQPGRNDREWRPGNWTPPGPAYVAVIQVDEDRRFEAAALEEFLIAQLGPPDNTTGIKGRRARTSV